MEAKSTRRLARVKETMKAEIARLLQREIQDPCLAWVTITDVDVSPDLKNARAYFVVTAGGQDNELVEKHLNRAAPFLQTPLGRNLKLRHTPKLTFKFDPTFDNAERIDRIIDEVQGERSGRPAPTAEETLARLVSESMSILVVAHRNPDGDAVGSLLGFSRILELLGKTPLAFCPEGVPRTLSFLSGAGEVTRVIGSDLSFELTVCLDTADEQLLPDGLPERARMGTVVVIDHHKAHGDFGDVVIRREASSVGEILLDLQKTLVWPIDDKVAECLYTSIVSDTGSFRYDNTKESTHRAAAELIEAGARSWVVATALFESYPLHRQKLLASVLETLNLSHKDRYAELYCTPKMLEAAGASKEDLDNLINFGRSVDTVDVAAMLRVEPKGEIKVSFRSKGSFDVAALASRFGGGGHKNASGCTLRDMDLEKARETIALAVGELFAS